MNRDMNTFGQSSSTRLGRILHDLARHDVPEDRDLRDQVMHAIQQRSADRASDDAERVWNLPALNPARQRRRVSVPDTSEERPMAGTPATDRDELISIPKPSRLREVLMIAAAAIIFAIIGAVLALALRSGDPEDESSIPGIEPASSPTVIVSPTSNRTATSQAAHTALAELTVVAEAATTATAASLPSPGEIVATIEVGPDPQPIAASADAIWVGNAQEGTVSRIDPATNAVVATIEIGAFGSFGPYGSPAQIMTYEDQIWVANNGDGTIERIDPARNQVVQTFQMFPANSSGLDFSLAVDASGLWVTDFKGGRLVHLDPVDGTILAEVEIADPNQVTIGFDSVWVMAGPDYGPYNIVRVDPTSLEIVSEIPVDVNEGVTVITSTDGIWVSDWGSNRIIRIDPATNAIATTLENPLNTSHDIAITSNGVWVSSIFADGVVRIDPATNSYSRTIDAEHQGSVGMVEAFNSIWVTHGADGLVVRIDPAP